MNLGMPEIILISVASLLLFGPKRLPDLARAIGGSLRAFKEGLKEGLPEPGKDEPKKP